MRVSRWLILSLVAASMLLGAKAMEALVVPSPTLAPRTLALGSGYSLLVAFAISRSKAGVQRQVMIVAGGTILLAYVLRMVVLSFSPSSFTHSLAVDLTDDNVGGAIAFMAAGTVGFWVGSYWFAGRVQRDSGDQIGVMAVLMRHARLVILLAMAGIFVWSSLNVAVGAGVDSVLPPWLVRLIPVDALVFVVAFLSVKLWRRLPVGDRIALIVFFAVYVAGGISIGARHSLFLPVLALGVAAIAQRGDPVLRVKTVVVVVAVGAIAVPTLLGTTVFLRDVVRGERTPVITWVIGGGEVFDSTKSLSAVETFWIVTQRASAFDNLAAVVAYQPPGIEDHLTYSNVMKSGLQIMLPDPVLDWSVYPLGKVFAVFYQGVAWDTPHHGAFSGFGFFYAIAGRWLGVLGLLVLGTGAALVMRKAKKSELLYPLQGYLLFAMVVAPLESGNLDGVWGNAGAQLTLVVGVFGLMQVGRKNSILPSVGKGAPPRAVARSGSDHN